MMESEYGSDYQSSRSASSRCEVFRMSYSKKSSLLPQHFPCLFGSWLPAGRQLFFEHLLQVCRGGAQHFPPQFSQQVEMVRLATQFASLSTCGSNPSISYLYSLQGGLYLCVCVLKNSTLHTASHTASSGADFFTLFTSQTWNT